MPKHIRYMREPNSTFEVTIRTLQERFLLRPSKQLNDIVLGVIGRALTRYPVLLHLIVVLSDHFHMILTAANMELISNFMCYINSNIAREIGKLHGWPQKFWGKRFTEIDILDKEKMIERTRYLLSHGCKEGLVLRPGDWPGINCVDAVCRGKKLVGTWYDRTKEYEARRAGKPCRPGQFATRYEVHLHPLPIHRDLDIAEQRAWYRAIVAEIELETKKEFGRGGRRVQGVKAVLRQDPHRRARKPKKSPRPLCHCSDPEQWKKYRDDYRWFLGLYRDASRRLRRGEKNVKFPPGCFPPALAFCNPGPDPPG